MTRWDVLKDLLLSHEMRKAIGKAWPLFFYLVLQNCKSNKIITSYAELKETLLESPSTVKKWRDHLVKNQVIKVINGRLSMTMCLLHPYDCLVTCEVDDMVQVKMNGDPATKRLLDKVSSYGNMSLLPLIAELSTKIDRLEKDR